MHMREEWYRKRASKTKTRARMIVQGAKRKPPSQERLNESGAVRQIYQKLVRYFEETPATAITNLKT